MQGDNILKVRISEADFGHSYSIWIYYEYEGIESSSYRVIYFDQNGNSEIKDVPKGEGEGVSPTLKLSSKVLEKLAEAIQGIGIKMPEQGKIEGLYEASQKHLEDMRKLVFKERK